MQTSLTEAQLCPCCCAVGDLHVVVNNHNSCGNFVASWNGHTTPNLLSRQAYDVSFAVQSNKLVRLSEIFCHGKR